MCPPTIEVDPMRPAMDVRFRAPKFFIFRFGAWLAPTMPHQEGSCALVVDENSDAMTIQTSHVRREPAKGIVSFRLTHTGQCLRVCVIDGRHSDSELVTAAQTHVLIVSNASLVVL